METYHSDLHFYLNMFYEYLSEVSHMISPYYYDYLLTFPIVSLT